MKDVNVDPELPEGTTIVLKGNFNSVCGTRVNHH